MQILFKRARSVAQIFRTRTFSIANWLAVSCILVVILAGGQNCSLTGRPSADSAASLLPAIPAGSTAESDIGPGPAPLPVPPPAQIPVSCRAVQATNPAAKSGTYKIDPTGMGNSYYAYCDMQTDGGGWTLIYKATNHTASHPATAPSIFEHWSVGNGQPNLLNENPTPADRKNVVSDIPVDFSDVLLKEANLFSTGQVQHIGNSTKLVAFAAKWRSFFGNPGNELSVATPQNALFSQGNSSYALPCSQMPDGGLVRHLNSFLYPQYGVLICMPEPGQYIDSIYIGDAGCGVVDCGASWHLFYPGSAIAGGYDTNMMMVYYGPGAINSSNGTPAYYNQNENVRMFVR